MRSNARAASRNLRSVGEGVGFQPLRALAGERRIRGEVLACAAASAAAELSIDGDAGRAAGQRGQREAAGVAEHVEHFAAGRERADRARGCRAGRDRSRSSGRRRRRRGRRGRPRRNVTGAGSAPRTTPMRGGEAFELAHLGVGALEDAGDTGHARPARRRSRRASAPRRPRTAARRRPRRSGRRPRPAGRPIRACTSRQPVCRVVLHRGAGRDGARRCAAGRSRRRSGSRGSKRPDPRADLRRRRIGGAAENRAVGRDHA